MCNSIMCSQKSIKKNKINGKVIDINSFPVVKKFTNEESVNDINRLKYLQSLTFLEFRKIGFLEHRQGKEKNITDDRILYNQIMKYVNLMVDNNNKYTFTYTFKDCYDDHRLICNNNGQNNPFRLRAFLHENHSTDLDICCCHQSILKKICDELKIPNDKLTYYINNKKEVRKINEPNKKNLPVKSLINKMINLNFFNKELKNEYLIELNKEIIEIQIKLYKCKRFKKQRVIACNNLTEDLLKKGYCFDKMTDKQKHQILINNNVIGKFISLLLISYEKKIVMELIDFVKNKGYQVNSIFHDGFFIIGDLYENTELLRDAEKHIDNIFHFNGLFKLEYKKHEIIEDLELVDYSKWKDYNPDTDYYKKDEIDIKILDNKAIPFMENNVDIKNINNRFLNFKNIFKTFKNNNYKYLCIKSGLGTGKTTFTFNFLSKFKKYNFIFINSLTSLTQKLYHDCLDNNIKTLYYTDIDYKYKLNDYINTLYKYHEKALEDRNYDYEFYKYDTDYESDFDEDYEYSNSYNIKYPNFNVDDTFILNTNKISDDDIKKLNNNIIPFKIIIGKNEIEFPVKPPHLDDYNCFTTTIDSICKLNRTNLLDGDYILIMDEIIYMINYIIRCDNLKKNRINIFIMLINVINKAKYVICLDGFMNDFVINLINFVETTFSTNNKVLYINNSYKKNKDVEVIELDNIDELYKLLKSEDKWLLCSDSKTCVDNLKIDLKDIDIAIYTSDRDKDKSTDLSIDRTAISPAIINGIDVFTPDGRICVVFNMEHTIDIQDMYQQCCRERNMTKLYILFIRKKYYKPQYLNYDICCKEHYHKLNQYKDSVRETFNNYSYNNINFNTVMDFFNEQYLKNKYIKNIQNTNPFSYFVELIESEGMNFINKHEKGRFVKNKKKFKETIKTIKEIKKDNIMEYIKKKDLMFLNYNTDIIEKNDDFENIIIDEHRLNNHFFICNTRNIKPITPYQQSKIYNCFKYINDFNELSTNEIINNVNYQFACKYYNDVDDFDIIKVNSFENRYRFLKKVEMILNCEYSDEIIINNDLNSINTDLKQELYNEYQLLFRDRSKSNTFEYRHLTNMFKNIYGKEHIDNKKIRKQLNKDKYLSYEYKFKNIDTHFNLLKLRTGTLENFNNIENVINHNRNIYKDLINEYKQKL